jgi:AraC family transcriptional regulator
MAEAVRIYEIPDCKMVSSGIGMFGEENFEHFDKWFSSLPKTIYPQDFLFWDGEWQVSGGFHWVYVYTEGMNVPGEFKIIDFKGGFYAVVTDIDGQPNETAMQARDDFLKLHNLEIDRSRPELGHVIGQTPGVKGILGYNQMDYWTPIKPFGK